MYFSLLLGINHINFGLCWNGRWYSLYRSLISPFKIKTDVWDNTYRQQSIPLPPRGSPGLEHRRIFFNRSSYGHITLHIHLGR